MNASPEATATIRGFFARHAAARVQPGMSRYGFMATAELAELLGRMMTRLDGGTLSPKETAAVADDVQAMKDELARRN